MKSLRKLNLNSTYLSALTFEGLKVCISPHAAWFTMLIISVSFLLYSSVCWQCIFAVTACDLDVGVNCKVFLLLTIVCHCGVCYVFVVCQQLWGLCLTGVPLLMLPIYLFIYLFIYYAALAIGWSSVRLYVRPSIHPSVQFRLLPQKRKCMEIPKLVWTLPRAVTYILTFWNPKSLNLICMISIWMAYSFAIGVISTLTEVSLEKFRKKFQDVTSSEKLQPLTLKAS